MNRRTALLAILLASARGLCAQALGTAVNYNHSTPAAPFGTVNVTWQHDNGRPVVNSSAYVTYPTLQIQATTGGDLSPGFYSCLTAINASYGGICDARGATNAASWASAITINKSNVVLMLPCATITASHALTIAPGIRNTSILGCAYKGGSDLSGTAGGSVWLFTSSGPAFIVGDPSYATNTPGFVMRDLNINTASAASTAEAIHFYRTQEIRLDNLYLNGDGSTGQTAITLDGTGNYSGGLFTDIKTSAYGTAWLLTGHLSGSVVDDYANASTFEKLHVICSTSGGSPIAGTYGVNILGGDGNTWDGGDVEGCSTMFHLASNATANTVVGLRNENSTMQYVADSGSSYNYVATGGTFFTGKITDSGSRNSFWDAFHRTTNGVAGDWYASQLDSTITGHHRLGIGLGNERGLQDEIQTDYGYRWETGYTDATAGEQFWYVTDLLNNLQRLSIGQYLSATANVVTNVVINNGGCYSSSSPPSLVIASEGGTQAAGTPVMAVSSCSGGWAVISVTITNNGTNYTTQPGLTWSGSNQLTQPSAVAEITTAGDTNNQTAINAAGTGAVVINGSAGAGTGGLVVAGGGITPAQVAAIDNTGNTALAGNLTFNYASVAQWVWECASTAVCALHNSAATTPANVFRAFPNAGTEIDSQGTSPVSINGTATGGTGGLSVYGGGATYYNTKVFSIAPDGSGGAVYFLPTIKASSGHNCIQIDNTGYLSNTGSGCRSGSGSGTVDLGSPWSPAFYHSSDTEVGGTTPFTGLEYWPGGAAPAAATAAQVVAVIGSTAVTNATNAATAASTSGNAATASASDHSPSQCSTGLYSTGNTTAWAANCFTVQYSQLGGSVPTWNQDTTGSAAKINAAAIPLSAPRLASNGSNQIIAAANTLGCLDGFDHLPCIVYAQATQSESSPTAVYATLFTTTATGVYRVTGYLYGTAASSTSYTVGLYCQAQQVSQPATKSVLLQSWQIGSSLSGNNGYADVLNLGTSVNIQCETATVSGTQTGGTWNRAVMVERLQ